MKLYAEIIEFALSSNYHCLRRFIQWDVGIEKYAIYILITWVEIFITRVKFMSKIGFYQ